MTASHLYHPIVLQETRQQSADILHAPIAASMAGRTRYAILIICCSSLFLASLDNTIVNVALPSIAKDLETSLPRFNGRSMLICWCWRACSFSPAPSQIGWGASASS
jgi:hypothetical protein